MSKLLPKPGGRRWSCWPLFLWAAIGLLSAAGANHRTHALITHNVTPGQQRWWTDSTGRFQVQGMLVGYGPQHIRIEKTNGRHSTVPISRLSQTDKQFIDQFESFPTGIRDRRDTVFTAPSGPPPVVPFDPRWSAAVDGQVLGDLVHLRVSRQLLSQMAERRVEHSDPVEEAILGFPVSGSAHTVSTTRLRLLVNSERAQLEIPVQGSVRSQTQTLANSIGEVQVHNLTVTHFQRLVRITVDERGVDIAAEPLNLRTERTITGVTTSLPPLVDCMVRRLTRRKAEADKVQFDEEVRRRVEANINRGIDTQLQDAVKELQRNVDEAVATFEKLPPSLRLLPRFRTDEQHLFVALGKPLDDSTPIQSPPPPIDFEPPFAVQIHASLIQEVLSDRELVERLRPVLSRFLGQNDLATKQVRQDLGEGDVELSWSTDSSWLTVVWFPRQSMPDRLAQDRLTRRSEQPPAVGGERQAAD